MSDSTALLSFGHEMRKRGWRIRDLQWRPPAGRSRDGQYRDFEAAMEAYQRGKQAAARLVKLKEQLEADIA